MAKKAAKSKKPAARKSTPAAKRAAKTATTKSRARTTRSKASAGVKVAATKASQVPARSAARLKSRISDKPGSAGTQNVLITAPVKTSPVSPLKARDLVYFKDRLLAKRRDLLGDVASMESEALRSTSGSNLSNLPIHMADMGTDNYEQEFTLGLVEKDRQLLREINLALDKLRSGTYGICEGTGKPISKVRLEAKPWARYCLEYTQKIEKGLVRR